MTMVCMPHPRIDEPPHPSNFADQDEDFMENLIEIMDQIYSIAFGWGANVEW